jgi:hypothetical protein
MKTLLYFVLVLGLVGISLAPPLIPIDGSVAKCSIKAGKADGLDSITCSGSLDATNDMLLAAEEIVVTLGTVAPWTFPVDASTYLNGRYRYVSKADGSQFQWDVLTKKMTFVDKTADLTGLACPINMTIQIGIYSAQIVLDEDLVNGSKPCPPQLLMGAVNSLQVSRRTLTFGQTAASDTLMVDGYFTIEGIYDAVSDLPRENGSGKLRQCRGVQ